MTIDDLIERLGVISVYPWASLIFRKMAFLDLAARALFLFEEENDQVAQIIYKIALKEIE